MSEEVELTIKLDEAKVREYAKNNYYGPVHTPVKDAAEAWVEAHPELPPEPPIGTKVKDDSGKLWDNDGADYYGANWMLPLGAYPDRASWKWLNENNTNLTIVEPERKVFYLYPHHSSSTIGVSGGVIGVLAKDLRPGDKVDRFTVLSPAEWDTSSLQWAVAYEVKPGLHFVSRYNPGEIVALDET